MGSAVHAEVFGSKVSSCEKGSPRDPIPVAKPDIVPFKTPAAIELTAATAPPAAMPAACAAALAAVVLVRHAAFLDSMSAW